MSERRNIFTLTAAILCVSIVGVALSLSIPVLSFALESKGASSTLIGLNTAMGGIATIFLAPFVPSLARRMGVGTLLLSALLLGAVTMISFWFFGALVVWFGLRFLLGASLAVIFVLSEFWVNAAAPETSRGLVMGIYATVLSVGFATGPFILIGLGSTTVWPYAAGSLIFICAIIPVLLVTRHAPHIHAKTAPTSTLGFIRKVPAATLAAFIYGAVETGCFSLLPIYSVRMGYTENHAAFLVTAFALGNVVAQIPLGLLSDRVDRFKILVALALIGLAGALLIPFISPVPELFYPLVAVWGGLTAGLYTVGLAHLGAQYKDADLAGANAAFVMLYSIGIIFGPSFIGFGMDLVGPQGMPLSVALLFILYLLLTFIWTKGQKRREMHTKELDFNA